MSRDMERPPAHLRGYDAQWRKVRSEVLRASGIPVRKWHKWSVDHRPRYNPVLEPDHRRYELVPMLRGSHSSKTARQDGAFGRGPAAVWRHNLPRPGELLPEAVYLLRKPLRWEDCWDGVSCPALL